MKFHSVLMAVTAITLCAWSHTAVGADIPVAVAGPMTGMYSEIGEQMKKGVDAAISDINSAGGISGQKLNIVVFDDACDAKQAVAVANQISKMSVKIVIGHFCANGSRAASEIYKDEGIVQISLVSSGKRSTGQGYGLDAYASLQAYVQAVRKSGSESSERVREELAKGNFDTVVGRIRFSGQGNDPSAFGLAMSDSGDHSRCDDCKSGECPQGELAMRMMTAKDECCRPDGECPQGFRRK